MNDPLHDLEQRLAQLEQRVGILQDREEIANVIARYGPAVDSGSAENTSGLWAETGTYSYPFGGETVTLDGRQAMYDMVLGDTHQGIIRGGAAHILTPVAITIEGDRATAIGYSLLVRLVPTDGTYEVWRVSANRWKLGREPEGWRVTARENHLMDSSPESRDLLHLSPGINIANTSSPDTEAATPGGSHD